MRVTTTVTPTRRIHAFLRQPTLGALVLAILCVGIVPVGHATTVQQQRSPGVAGELAGSLLPLPTGSNGQRPTAGSLVATPLVQQNQTHDSSLVTAPLETQAAITVSERRLPLVEPSTLGLLIGGLGLLVLRRWLAKQKAN